MVAQNTMENRKMDNDDDDSIPVITDNTQLLQYGVCRVPLPPTLDAAKWANELSQVTPEIMLGQGDGEYSFYRNIMEEPDFPFDTILDIGLSEIGRAILKYFPITSTNELLLDDAFCVHYNTDQEDTTGAKHMDPSDITVNLCLEKTDDTIGSHVLFYGTKQLQNTGIQPHTTQYKQHQQQQQVGVPDRFYVVQEPGTATIHFGDHPHETIALTRGKRTNVVLTYCYKDPKRSGAQMRSCYF